MSALSAPHARREDAMYGIIATSRHLGWKVSEVRQWRGEGLSGAGLSHHVLGSSPGQHDFEIPFSLLSPFLEHVSFRILF